MSLPKTAKAAVFTQPNEPMELRDLEVCEPRDGEALIQVLRSNICGSDVHMYEGKAFAGFGVPFPFVLGHEMVGRVAALGAGVETDATGEPLAVGDRVTLSYYKGCGGCPICARGHEHACMGAMMSIIAPAEKAPHFTGGFAQYYRVRKGQALYKLPDAVPTPLAAGINCALAQVVHGLTEARLREGEQVVIQGAGGLGLYATAVAKGMGASKVVVIDGVGERLALAKRLGADVTVSLEDMPEPKQRTRAVKDATNGGADVVVEVVGRSDALREGVRMLQRTGRYLVMGAINPKQPVKLDPSIWVGSNLRLIGVSLYPHSILSQAIAFVETHHDSLPLDEMIRTFPLSEVNEAMAAAQSRQGACRIQLDTEIA